MTGSGSDRNQDHDGSGEGRGDGSDGISIVIAEDSLLVRDRVSRALSTDPHVTVVGVAEDYDSAVELVEAHGLTIVVTDVRMPPTSTDEEIRLAGKSLLAAETRCCRTWYRFSDSMRQYALERLCESRPE